MRAALALLLTAGVAVGAASLGFSAGATSAAASAGATGPVVIGAGIHLFGLFLFLPFLFFAFFAMMALIGGRRHRHHAWGMHGGFGPAGFGPGGFGPMGPKGPFADGRRAWVAEAHRRLHEEEAARAAGSASTDGPADGPKAG